MTRYGGIHITYMVWLRKIEIYPLLAPNFENLHYGLLLHYGLTLKSPNSGTVKGARCLHKMFAPNGVFGVGQ